ncbi:MAG: DUF1540 domain-containing protein [Lachnospiraceae bacterium]|nr:DUF1540 domain-containing protein [Lachnospiraceae bacterium]
MLKNESIECTINNCKNYADDVNFCTLNKIKVGTHEANPTQAECTECQSFVCRAAPEAAKTC